MNNRIFPLNLFKIALLFSFTLLTILMIRTPVFATMTTTVNPNSPNTDSQIRIDWTSVSSAVYYNILREGIKIATIDVNRDINSSYYIDKNLIPETYYSYTVQRLDASGTVLESYLNGTMTTAMLKPIITSAVYDINNNNVTLSWSNYSLAATQCKISNIYGEEITTMPITASKCTFSDYSISSNQSKSYLLMLKDTYGHVSPYSDAVYITSVEAPIISVAINNGTSTISWSTNPYISYFQLERSSYIDGLWTAWEAIQNNISPGLTSTTDPYQTGSTYRYRLSSKHPNYIGYSNISNVIAMPVAPSKIDLSQSEAGKITLAWSSTINPGDFMFRIERKADTESAFQSISSLSADSVSYEDTNGIFANRTYSYRIVAYNSNNNQVLSPESSIFTGAPLPAENLYINVVSTTEISLNWSDKSNNEQYFRIEKKKDGGIYEILTQNISANTTNYTDTDILADCTYTYKVIPYNASGYASKYSNEVSYTTVETLPVATSIAVEATSPTEIQITWTYADDESYGSCIERKIEDTGTWENLVVLNGGVTTYDDKGLVPNTKYYYRVKVLISENVYSTTYPDNSTGESATTMLPAPENLKGHWGAASKITLNWTDILEETSYVIERGTSEDSFDVVSRTTANVVNFSDSELDSTTEYYYRIKATNKATESPYSEIIGVKAYEFWAPDGFAYSVISGKKVLLSWKDNTSDETGFIVQRKSNETDNWKDIASLKSNSTSFLDEDVKLESSYIYCIKVFNSTFDEGVSSIELNVTIENIEAPSNLSVQSLSPTEVSLNWKSNSSNEQGFIIERKEKYGNFSEVKRINSNNLTFTDSELEPMTQYFYRVRSYNDTLLSDYSKEIYVTTSIPYNFSDIENVDWAKTAITNLANKGILKGRYNNSNLFVPFDKITRAEFISLIVRTLKFDTEPIGSFDDVKPEQWFYKDIAIAKQLGIISGFGNKFYPNNLITRQDIATITVRAFSAINKPLRAHSSSVLSGYSDLSSVSGYAIPGLATLCGEKVIGGKGGNILAPKDYATRAETAVILFKVLELK